MNDLARDCMHVAITLDVAIFGGEGGKKVVENEIDIVLSFFSFIFKHQELLYYYIYSHMLNKS